MPEPKKTLNELWEESIIARQIGLLLFGNSVKKKITTILDVTETDIKKEVVSELGKKRTPSRITSLLRTIGILRGEAWTESTKVWKDEILAAANAEAEFLETSLKHIAPVVLDTTAPSAELLRQIVTQRPIQGAILGDWSKNIRRADLRRIEQQIQIGLVQGESAAQVARRIVGTVRLKGKDGVTEITRREADAITRTALLTITNSVREEFFNENSDLFEQEKYLATLDSRTTPICRSLDGNLYPVGVGPKPPVHWNCRSVRVAIITPELDVNRPYKAVTKQQLLREYTASAGIQKKVGSREDLPRGHKSKFDEFARRRTRELTGTVPERTTYESFLRSQSPEFQADVMGKAKAKLFRDGGLTLDKFVEPSGRELTLKELAERHKDAFRRAGL